MPSFLVVYGRRSGKVETVEYDVPAQAFAQRLLLEEESDSDTEIVVVQADSLEDLRATHRRFFESASEMMASLQAPHAEQSDLAQGT